MNWKDITVDKYLQMQAVDEEDDTYREIAYMAILLDKTEDELLDMPLTKFQKLRQECEWVNTAPKVSPHLPKKIKINGVKCEVVKSVTKLTTAQFIDYNNYAAEQMVPEMLSVFIIPKGKKYGDYDLDKHIEGIRNMSLETALGILYFFQKRFLQYTNSTLFYLRIKLKNLMRKAKNKEVQAKLQQAISMLNGVG